MTRTERLSAVLYAVRALRPSPLAAGITADERALWEMLVTALDCAIRLSGTVYVSPLATGIGTLREAHAVWADVRADVLRVLDEEARGQEQARSRVAEHAVALRREWAQIAWRVDRLFEDLTEGRA